MIKHSKIKIKKSHSQSEKQHNQKKNSFSVFSGMQVPCLISPQVIALLAESVRSSKLHEKFGALIFQNCLEYHTISSCVQVLHKHT